MGGNKKHGVCYVIGAGDNYGLTFLPGPDDYVIAADGGLKYLEQSNIEPDLVIGDFDTLQYIPQHRNVIRLNPQKNETDMFAAVSQGIALGYREFHVFCGTGGRADHTFANIQMLVYLANRKMQGLLFDRDCVFTVIKDSEYTFASSCEGYVSIFSISEKSTGVYLENLKYELKDAELSNDFPLGVSNELIGAEGKVRVGSGTLLIAVPRNSPKNFNFILDK